MKVGRDKEPGRDVVSSVFKLKDDRISLFTKLEIEHEEHFPFSN